MASFGVIFLLIWGWGWSGLFSILLFITRKSQDNFFPVHSEPESGVEKLTRSSLKGVSNRALFAYKNAHLNRTGSVFALPTEVALANETKESGVHEFSGKKSGNGFANPLK